MTEESEDSKDKDEYNKVISNLCESIKNGELIVFLGAGISKNSGLPLAHDLETHILKNFGLPIEDINRIIESNFPFEAFIGNILRNTDISPILKIFEKGQPNINHIFIARLAKAGMIKTIVTTNFDLLLENALINEGLKENENFPIFFTDEHYANVNYENINDKLTIFKIHGSIIEDNSIRTILNELAQCRGSDYFNKLLKFIYSEGKHHKVLILGYSCSDEFDISPIINKITEEWKNVIIVNHISDIIYKIESIKDKGKKNPFRLFPGIRVYTNSDDFVKNLWSALEEHLGVYRFFLNPDLWRSEIDIWTEEQKKNNIHYQIVGDVFSSISLWEKSIEYYEKALGGAEINEHNNDIFSKLGIAYFGSGEFEKSAIYHEKTLKFILQYRRPDLECVGYFNLGGIYLGLGDFKKAIDYCEKAHDLSLISGNKGLKSGINTNLGIANFVLGNSKTAIKYFERDLEISRHRKDLGGEALTSIFLGNVYCTLKEFEKAQELYSWAESIALPLGSNTLISLYYTGMGILNINKKNYENAIDYFKKSLEIDKSVNDQAGISRCYVWLGYSYLGCGKYEHSHECFNKGLDLATKFKYQYEIARCYIGLGKIAYYSNENAANYFRKALEISEKYEYQREILSCNEYLDNFYQETQKITPQNSYFTNTISRTHLKDSGNIIPNNLNFKQYDELLQILKRFYKEGIIGDYSLKKTLFFLAEIKPPFTWMDTESAEGADISSQEFREMVYIFEGIRHGLLNSFYSSKILDSELQLFQIHHNFVDHFSAIYDHVLNARISWCDLQYYFYFQKKLAKYESFQDILVNLILLMMITYWVYLWNNVLITHNEVLDCLIDQKDPTYLM